LPYYGEILRGYTAPSETAKNLDERKYGKIPNPTVHIGLNQLRQLVNEVIHRYGHPHSVIIELTREFGVSGEHRREIENNRPIIRNAMIVTTPSWKGLVSVRAVRIVSNFNCGKSLAGTMPWIVIVFIVAND